MGISRFQQVFDRAVAVLSSVVKFHSIAVHDDHEARLHVANLADHAATIISESTAANAGLAAATVLDPGRFIHAG